MAARKKIDYVAEATLADELSRASKHCSAKELAALEKDWHLVCAAMESDKLIVTGDRRAVGILRRVKPALGPAQAVRALSLTNEAAEIAVLLSLKLPLE